MRPATITQLAKKTAAIVISGTVLVAMGSLALAETHEGDEGDDLVEDPVVDPIEETCDAEVEECPTDDDETCDPDVDVEECTTDDEELEDEVPEVEELEDEGPEVEELEDEGPEVEELEGEYENHGHAVREAARETCPKGPGHGQCVSEVARSDLGKKPKHDAEVEQPETVEEPETDEEPAAASLEPMASGDSGQGKENAGQGKGASKKR